MRENLADQREALTEDVDDGSGGGSGGEPDPEQPETSTPRSHIASSKKEKKALQDSMKPCMIITALLLTFAALAVVVVFVLSAAFNPEGPELSHSPETVVEAPLLTTTQNAER